MESTAIYDLTTLLTTNASISASFVAILGGFIASKLITISGERASTLEKIHSLSEEITVKTALKESLQYENDESDALDFIDSNFVSLARKVNLDDLYPTLSNSSIKKESLQPFWDNAQEILLQYHSTLQSGTCKTIDEVKKIIIQQHPTPVGFANDFFDVIQRQLDIIQHKQEKKHPSSNSIYDKLALATAPIYTPPPKVKSTVWDNQRYETNLRKIAELANEIQLLTLQMKQYKSSKLELQNPKGMKIGLLIFALITFINIVLPVIFIPFETSDVKLYRISRLFFILFFIIGLTSIFLYMIWLLNWKESNQ